MGLATEGPLVTSDSKSSGMRGMESRLPWGIRTFMKFVIVEKCCHWENLLEKSSRVRCGGILLFLNAGVAMIAGGLGEEVDVSTRRWNLCSEAGG